MPNVSHNFELFLGFSRNCNRNSVQRKICEYSKLAYGHGTTNQINAIFLIANHFIVFWTKYHIMLPNDKLAIKTIGTKLNMARKKQNWATNTPQEQNCIVIVAALGLSKNCPEKSPKKVPIKSPQKAHNKPAQKRPLNVTTNFLLVFLGKETHFGRDH